MSDKDGPSFDSMTLRNGSMYRLDHSWIVHHVIGKDGLLFNPGLAIGVVRWMELVIYAGDGLSHKFCVGQSNVSVIFRIDESLVSVVVHIESAPDRVNPLVPKNNGCLSVFRSYI